MISKGSKVKITKLLPAKDAMFPSANAGTYQYGEAVDGVSLPVDYWAIGVLHSDIEVGQALSLLRENRNGVSALGVMTTSPVRTITKTDAGLQITTNNSVYRVELYSGDTSCLI